MNNDSRFNLEYENSNIFFPEISSGQTVLHNLNIFDFVTLNFNSFSLSITTHICVVKLCINTYMCFNNYIVTHNRVNCNTKLCFLCKIFSKGW